MGINVADAVLKMWVGGKSQLTQSSSFSKLAKKEKIDVQHAVHPGEQNTIFPKNSVTLLLPKYCTNSTNPRPSEFILCMTHPFLNFISLASKVG